MQVIDQDTGKTVILDSTPELLADLDSLNDPCAHTRQEMRRKRNRAGVLQYRNQCLGCGRPVGVFQKHSSKLEAVPDWDDQIERDYDSSLGSRRSKIVQKHVRIQRARSEGFWKDYNRYLSSDAWQEKRKLVFTRANGQCEGCGIRPATQVHHLTYIHVQREFLFELVALCDECHERLHADAKGEDVSTLPCDGCRYQSEKNSSRWCFLADVSAEEALSVSGGCGPQHKMFEALR